jgi:hypothetical protein
MRLSVIAGILLMGLSMAACTTTYTPAELEADEIKRDESDARGDRNDEEIGEEGGQNDVDSDEQIEMDYDQGEL